jgi:hypothetical protein
MMCRWIGSKSFKASLMEFMRTRKAELVRRIAQEKTMSPALTADVKAATDQFKETWR